MFADWRVSVTSMQHKGGNLNHVMLTIRACEQILNVELGHENNQKKHTLKPTLRPSIY